MKGRLIIEIDRMWGRFRDPQGNKGRPWFLSNCQHKEKRNVRAILFHKPNKYI